MSYARVGKSPLRWVWVLGVLLFASLWSDPTCGGEPESSVSFNHEIVPILTKAGCNAGACHAKAGGGQNGFQLSLLGLSLIHI